MRMHGDTSDIGPVPFFLAGLFWTSVMPLPVSLPWNYVLKYFTYRSVFEDESEKSWVLGAVLKILWESPQRPCSDRKTTIKSRHNSRQHVSP